MSWHGPITPGPNTVAVQADTHYARVLTVPDERLVKMIARLDGGGAGSGTQRVRAAIYDETTRELVAAGDDVTITAGDSARWVDLPLAAEYLGRAPGSTSLRVCLHGGPTGGVARVNSTAGSSLSWSDSFADGPAATCPPTGAALQIPTLALLTSARWTPEGADDLHVARYGFNTAQAVFLQSTAESRSQRFATCEWYGGKLSEEQGSNALVRSDGPLADLVGERLLVSDPAGGRSVAVYCHAENSQVRTDLSLSRRAFLAIGYLADEVLDVTVEVLV